MNSLWMTAGAFVFGTLLNAFCSGMETAFYRVARLRLLLDARQGGFQAKGLLWLSQRPELVVAALLLGVNLSNYVISIAIVNVAAVIFGSGGLIAETIISVILTPFLFVYADLLPKSVAFSAPYGVLRRWATWLFILTALLFPLSAILWALSRLLTYVLGESLQSTQESLARKELAKVFDEGHAAGILRPAQRVIAHAIVAAGQRKVTSNLVLAQRLPRVTTDGTRQDALRAAAMRRSPMVLVEENLTGRPLIGYVTVMELALSTSNNLEPIRPFLQLSAEETQIGALRKIYSSGENWATVINRSGTVLGIVFAERLAAELHTARA